ncbi:hypothetical protein MTR_6g464160 [Medicago truncatula]|uniref:Uncharacterized protein n=1 Tax=Medicago truncatula TaxID=3880 RepID=A0A072UA71_MEDTR|nr:hypothetical protein MTR_6g464160 [Medicago truncatula]
MVYTLDVCFALGLRIIGEKVNFKKEPTCTTKAMFDNEVINVKTIINMEGDEDVEKFCRLYLHLGFAEFYFPNSSVNVWALEHVLGYEQSYPDFPLKFLRFMKVYGVSLVGKNISHLLNNYLWSSKLVGANT